VQAELRGGFARWGLPRRIRVDNGAPWGSQGQLPPALALWLIGLGIEVIWNRPRRAQDNGCVERTHGVIVQWVEPKQCADHRCLQERVTWATTIQREKYPAIDGQSRLAAYPQLLTPTRPYDRAHEEAHWQLSHVTHYLAQGVWQRRVDKVGRISLYNWAYTVGRRYSGQDVSVRFDPTHHQWVVLDHQGAEIIRHPAQEITRQSILALDVSRKKHKGQSSCRFTQGV
jgi:hypothetical protein